MSPDAPPPGMAGWSLLRPRHLQGPPHPWFVGFPAGRLLQRDGCVPSSLTAVTASQPGGRQGLSRCHCPRAAAREVLVSRGRPGWLESLALAPPAPAPPSPCLGFAGPPQLPPSFPHSPGHNERLPRRPCFLPPPRLAGAGLPSTSPRCFLQAGGQTSCSPGPTCMPWVPGSRASAAGTAQEPGPPHLLTA